MNDQSNLKKERNLKSAIRRICIAMVLNIPPIFLIVSSALEGFEGSGAGAASFAMLLTLPLNIIALVQSLSALDEARQYKRETQQTSVLFVVLFALSLLTNVFVGGLVTLFVMQVVQIAKYGI